MGQTISSCSDSPPNYGDYTELKSKPDTSFYLHIHPRKLKFPFELGKKISCSLKLSNKSDDYVAFKITSPEKYRVRPKIGIVLPRSTCDVTVTMQPQKEAPPDMKCKDKFLIQSIVARPGATTKDITSEMFEKESGYEVDERKLRVVYVAPAKPSDKDSAPRASATMDKAIELISKLIEERKSLIEQNKRLQQELDVLRRAANDDSHMM